MPEESDFSWLESVCFGDGDFSPVFQRDAQTKITADVSDAKQTCRLEKRRKTPQIPVTADSRAQIPVKAATKLVLKYFLARRRAVQSLLYDIPHLKDTVSTVCISGLWKKSLYKTELS